MRRISKKSTIGGPLALSMVLTGTGYVYWTDTLNVTARATTSDSGMTFVDLGLYAWYGNEMTSNGWSIIDDIGDKTYVNSTSFMRATADYDKIARNYSIDACKEHQKGYNSIEFNTEFEKSETTTKNVGPYNTINAKGNHQIDVTISQAYPGYAQALHADVLNVGSIATELSSLKFNVRGLEDSDKAADMLGIALYMDGEQYHPTTDEGKPAFKLINSFAGEGDYFIVNGVDFIRLLALRKLSGEEIRKAIMNATAPCNPTTDNRINLLLTATMDPDAESVYTTGSTAVLAKNDDKANQKKTAEVSIDFLWDQFDIGKNAGSPNHSVRQNKSEER